MGLLRITTPYRAWSPGHWQSIFILNRMQPDEKCNAAAETIIKPAPPLWGSCWGGLVEDMPRP
jgi:hypothetical protein